MIYRYDPFQNVLRLKSLMDDFYKELPVSGRVRADFPYINLYEKDDTIIVEAVIPGVQREDVTIDLIDDTLNIAGERKSDYADKPYIRRERNFGKFKKAVKLPYQVNRENINAVMKDGILTVTLYKSEEAKPKKIEIK